VDYHSALEDPVFSPRVGLRLTPADNHSLRLTYNQAYLTPAISDLFLDLGITDDVFGIPVDEYMYGLRNVGVPETGYTFQQLNGELLFHSRLNTDRSMGLPVGQASAYWDGAVELVGPQLPEPLEQLLRMIQAPDASQVGGALAMLNIETEEFDPVDAAQVQDIARLTPTDLQSYEIGYKGMLSERLQVGMDVYYSEYENFITPARVATPNVFLDGAQTYAYLYEQAVPIIGETDAQAFAEAVAAGMAQVPLGTVTPEQASDRTELLMIPMNYGQVEYWGTDLYFKTALLRNLSVGGSYSYINDVYFEDVDGKGPLSLNTPKHKASLSLQYTEPSSGIQGTVRYRFIDGYRIKSGVYEGTINPSGLIDVGLRIPVPLPLRPSFILSARNLLDHQHVEFIGGGQIGRLLTGRLQLHF
jgi:iron complex outermembrane receptor protein